MLELRLFGSLLGFLDVTEDRFGFCLWTHKSAQLSEKGFPSQIRVVCACAGKPEARFVVTCAFYLPDHQLVCSGLL